MAFAPIKTTPKKAAAARKFKERLDGMVPKIGGDWRGDHEDDAKKLAAGRAAEKGPPPNKGRRAQATPLGVHAENRLGFGTLFCHE